MNKNYLIMGLMIIFCIGIASAYNLTDNLIGYYDLGNNSNTDITANVGIVNGGGSNLITPDNSSCLIGACKNSTDANAFIEFINTDMISNDTFTTNIWINPVDNYYQTIITNKGPYIRLFLSPSTDAILYYYWNNDGTSCGFDGTNSWAISTLYDGTWKMMTMTYDGYNWKGYYNGAEVLNGTCSVNLNQSLHDVYIGYNLGENAWAIGTLIDEFSVYDRALSPSEVTQLYNNGTGLTYPFIENVSCTENWINNNTVCNGYNYTIQYYDSNTCGTYTNLPINNGTIVDCAPSSITAQVTKVNNSIVSIMVALIIVGVLITLVGVIGAKIGRAHV